MIRVELAKLVRRPRTWLTILLLNALPTLVAVLVAVTGVTVPPGEGPAFLSAVLANGSLFAVAALAIVLPVFLPV
ncbi:MAG: ABC transporter permease, partial [Oryzihumus sp.]